MKQHEKFTDFKETKEFDLLDWGYKHRLIILLVTIVILPTLATIIDHFTSGALSRSFYEFRNNR